MVKGERRWPHPVEFILAVTKIAWPMAGRRSGSSGMKKHAARNIEREKKRVIVWMAGRRCGGGLYADGMKLGELQLGTQPRWRCGAIPNSGGGTVSITRGKDLLHSLIYSNDSCPSNCIAFPRL